MRVSVKNVMLVLTFAAILFSSYSTHLQLRRANLKIRDLQVWQAEAGSYFIDQLLQGARGEDVAQWNAAILKQLSEDETLKKRILHFALRNYDGGEYTEYYIIANPNGGITNSGVRRIGAECFTFYYKDGRFEKFSLSPTLPF